MEVELPSSFMALLEAGVAILEAEAAEVHATWFGDHADEYGPQIGGLVRAGLARDPASVARAREVRAAFQSAIAPLLEGVDALLSPVAPGPAPLRSEGTGDFMLCAPWSFAGVPSIGIPTGLDAAGLPLALQLVGASRPSSACSAPPRGARRSWRSTRGRRDPSRTPGRFRTERRRRVPPRRPRPPAILSA